jgi:hypothetical protein
VSAVIAAASADPPGLSCEDQRLGYPQSRASFPQPRGSRIAQGRKAGMESEIATLREAFVEAEGAIRDLRRLYDVGRMRVPMEGIVRPCRRRERRGGPGWLVEIYGEQPACGPSIA